MNSFITRQVHDITIIIQLEYPFASGPLLLRPCRPLRVRSSAEATSADHRCRLPPPPAQVATQMQQPMRYQTASSVGKRVCARRRKEGGNFLYPALSSRAPRDVFQVVESLVGNLIESSVAKSREKGCNIYPEALEVTFQQMQSTSCGKRRWRLLINKCIAH